MFGFEEGEKIIQVVGSKGSGGEQACQGITLPGRQTLGPVQDFFKNGHQFPPIIFYGLSC